MTVQSIVSIPSTPLPAISSGDLIPNPTTNIAVTALQQPVTAPSIKLIGDPLSTDDPDPTAIPAAPQLPAATVPNQIATPPKASPAPTPQQSSLAKITEVTDLTKYDHDEMLKFLRGELANVHGFSLTELQNLPFAEKEAKHNYIQWMWPTFEISEQQPGAKGPVINDEFVKKLKADPAAVKNAETSFEKMLEFYGLQEVSGVISKAASFAEREKEWCSGGYDHNHARISRILESLYHFGLEGKAQAFFKCLKGLWLEKYNRFTDKTMEIWCQRTGHLWAEVSLELKDLREEQYDEYTLDNLIQAKKDTHWILADLSTDESSWFGRLMWAICKHFKCLRNFFYDVDLDKAQQSFAAMSKRILGKENPRLARLREKWAAAAVNFNRIVGLKHHTFVSKQFNQITFVVKPGDVTKEPADVVVNAANEALLGGGGVDKVIHEAGGERILQECITIREQRKKANRSPDSEPGEAVTTTAGNIPATFVVHTVGPRWKDGKSKEEETLQKAYTNSLDQVAERNKASVNFPSISTGIFGFPLNKAAPIVEKAIEEHSKKQTSIRKVSILAFDHHTFLAFAKQISQ